MSKTHEKKFTDALRDIFVGAKIEGDSGYINLMRIKSRYYTEGVFPHLMEKIDQELDPFPNFREELFDKLYSFFKRYFSESGSIYFRHTAYHQDIYERIYTDDRDVMLFWKTQNLYYVKTDRLFRSLTLQLEDSPEQKYAFDASAVAPKSFSFDASTLQNKRNNEKRSLIFEYKGKAEDETLRFAVQYAESGKKTKTDDILKAIKKDGVKVNEDQLTRAFRLFERQSEVDFFINKNAKAFLTEQFDLWMYQYLFKRESEFNEKRIKQMQALKRIAYSIIEFISQFEDELVRIWNKPKFAHSSNYVITFDRIFGKSEAVARRLLEHNGMSAQVAEWKQLGIIGDDFTVTKIFEVRGENGELDYDGNSSNQKFESLNAKLRFLPFDTKHFKSLENEIISLFNNLDDELDGRLIHSENYQALNTLKDKFRDEVQSIYVDPPYNTNASEIQYVNDYKHSSWLSLIEDRLQLAKEWLKTTGILSIAIDDLEFYRLRALLGDVFGESRILGTVCIRSNPAGRSTVKGFSSAHEYTIFVAKDEESPVGRLDRSAKQIARYDKRDEKGAFEWVNFRKHGGDGANRDARPKMFYPIFATKTGQIRIPDSVWDEDKMQWITLESPGADEVEVLPIDSKGVEKRWKWGRKAVLSSPNDFSAKPDQTGKAGIYMKSRLKEEGMLPTTWWEKREYSSTEYGTNLLRRLIGTDSFLFPKSIFAVEECLRVTGLGTNDTCLDFFAGSGTTAHAVIDLNRKDDGKRKYILVEANDYFHTVILPRIKKVIFSDNWKDGRVKEGGKGISHFCKYYALEQYEDALRRAEYIDDSATDTPSFFNNPYESPFSSYVFLRDRKMSDALAADYTANKIRIDFSKLYEDIDWGETLSCVKGKRIKTQTAESVTFDDGETVNFDEIDHRDILPLIWWDK